MHRIPEKLFFFRSFFVLLFSFNFDYFFMLFRLHFLLLFVLSAISEKLCFHYTSAHMSLCCGSRHGCSNSALSWSIRGDDKCIRRCAQKTTIVEKRCRTGTVIMCMRGVGQVVSRRGGGEGSPMYVVSLIKVFKTVKAASGKLAGGTEQHNPTRVKATSLSCSA